MKNLKGLQKYMKSEETGTTYQCKMQREKVRTSRNQFELHDGKDNKIEDFQDLIFLEKAKSVTTVQ